MVKVKKLVHIYFILSMLREILNVVYSSFSAFKYRLKMYPPMESDSPIYSSSKGMKPPEDLRIDRRIILKWILEN